MNRPLSRALLITSAAATIALSGCAYNYPYGYGPYSYLDGFPYYHGYYGPYADGYWGADGFFYFFNVNDGHFHRDDGHHFRHDAAPGFAGVAPHSSFVHNMPGNPSHGVGAGVPHGGGGGPRGGGGEGRRG